MPANKFALIRYRVIDKCIGNKYRPYPSIDDLMDKCSETLGKQVSKSTIEKDISAMKFDAGLGYEAPILFSREYAGYYYDNLDFTISDVPLNDEEIDAIKIAANTLVQFRDVGPFKQYSTAIDKVLNRVSIEPGKNDGELKSIIQFEQVPEVKGNHLLGLLFKACDAARVVEFDYGSFKKNRVKRRMVEPYLLKEYDNRWYLIGKSREKRDFIVYGLDRMHRLNVTDEKFERSSSFNPDVYFRYSIGITANLNEEPMHVELEVNDILAKYLESKPLHKTQELVKNQGKNILKLRVYNTYELHESILGFGKQARVVKPDFLQKQIRETLAEAASQYESKK